MQKALVGTSLPAFRPASSRPRSTTRSVKTHALFGLKTKKDKENDAADEEFVGFMYDPSMQVRGCCINSCIWDKFYSQARERCGSAAPILICIPSFAL